MTKPDGFWMQAYGTDHFFILKEGYMVSKCGKEKVTTLNAPSAFDPAKSVCVRCMQLAQAPHKLNDPEFEKWIADLRTDAIVRIRTDLDQRGTDHDVYKNRGRQVRIVFRVEPSSDPSGFMVETLGRNSYRFFAFYEDIEPLS